MTQVVLVHPQIGSNTGAVIRLAANLGFGLHLVEPLGFELSERGFRRAGLDYRELAEVSVHPDWQTAARAVTPSRRLAFTAHADRQLQDIAFAPDDVLVFGGESDGLPDAVVADCHPVRIPMLPHNRSINLANAVAIATYEAWRQHGFPGAAVVGGTSPEPVESFVRRPGTSRDDGNQPGPSVTEREARRRPGVS